MEKDTSKLENLKKAISEMEEHLAHGDIEDKSKDRISHLAEKGRAFINRAENKANEMADKMKEKKESYSYSDEEKKEKMWKFFITALIAFIAIMSLKKMKKKLHHRDEE